MIQTSICKLEDRIEKNEILLLFYKIELNSNYNLGIIKINYDKMFDLKEKNRKLKEKIIRLKKIESII